MTQVLHPTTLPAPALTHLCDLHVSVTPPIDVGHAPLGHRRIIPITGGVVRGERMHGKVLNAGADFQIIASGTTAHLDARYVIELDDGALVFVHNTALRFAAPEVSAQLQAGLAVDPALVYFRCQPRFETAAPQWQWLNHHQFIGTGQRAPDGVFLSFYQVL